MFFVETVRRDRGGWQPDPLPAWSLLLRCLALGSVVGGVVGWLAGYVVGLQG